jgi:hypothetical protein
MRLNAVRNVSETAKVGVVVGKDIDGDGIGKGGMKGGS